MKQLSVLIIIIFSTTIIYSQTKSDTEYFDNVVKAQYPNWVGTEKASESDFEKIEELGFDSDYAEENLPEEIIKCKNLKTIYIRIRITEWESNFLLISSLDSLQELRILTESKLQGIGVLSKCEKLKYLEILSHHLTSLPKGLGKLTSLEELDFYEWFSLRNIPKEIGNLTNLKSLNLGVTHCKKIPKEIGNLKSLTYLNLDICDLKKIPKEIGGCESLEYLDLGRNRLRRVPKEIGDCKKLEYLDLGQNRIKKIPKEIFRLEKLEYLDLGQNRIKRIPIEIIYLLLRKCNVIP